MTNLLPSLLFIFLLSTITSGSDVTEETFYVEENVKPGFLVGSLRKPRAISYSVTGVLSAFSVDSRYGSIRVDQSPDREERDLYEFMVIISFDNTQESSTKPQVVNVVIHITDVNDNSPVFPRKLISQPVTESQPVGFKITLDPAEDPDLETNSTQIYRIISGDSPFELKTQNMGIDNYYSPVLELVRPLDREVVPAYLVEIMAVDGGNPPRSDRMALEIMVADENDNTPQFNQSIYRPQISEDSPIGSVVCTVLATDNDIGDNADISYLIEPRFNRAGLFTIDTDTGVITLAGLLDRETADVHDLVVRASDNGQFPERTTVRVSVKVLDINDNTPDISVTFMSQDDEMGLISEASDIGDYVAHVNVMDSDVGDNGHVNLVLQNAGTTPFSIAPVGNGYAVVVSGPLDRETREFWDLNLEARDHGVPVRRQHSEISVRVVDVNDCPPVFEKQLFKCNVSEIAEQGTEIFRVSASDDDLGVNSEISYSILRVNVMGQSSEHPNTPISFSINSVSGIISTVTQLDREAMESVELTVEARDSGSPSLATTCTVVVEILDYNDNDPRFDERHYTTLITEDAAVGSTVLTVVASDADAGGTTPLTYSIKEYYSAAESLFAINPKSGLITTLSTLDYEEQKSYNLVVEAHDTGGRRGVTSVEVLIQDLNDNSPKFTQRVYKASLLHTVLPGTIATRVTAFDVDSGVNGVVSYKVLQGGEKFSVDSTTGFITTTVSLAGVTNTTERLTIEARDGGSPSQSSLCSVQVLIGSLSTIDLKPVFVSQEYEVETPESRSRGYHIVTVFAKSSDPDYRGSIKYTLSQLTRHAHSLFDVEEDSGRIVTRIPLDREETEQHNFVVEATDELGRRGMAAVKVSVTDVNDNKALFSAPNYHFSIAENVEEGAEVAQITASDLDYGVNGLVQYVILSPAPEDIPFRIDPLSGVVSVVGDVDFETVTQYKLRVKAYNRITTNFYRETSVKISIVDMNDNPPVFVQPSFSLNVLDSSLEGASVGVAMATDADSGRNGQLYYTIQPTEFSSLFEIDLRTGEIRTAVTFANKDDLMGQYTLKVLCRDRGNPSLNATVLVTVNVLSTGDVVDQLQTVLKNDTISRKAMYLLIVLAVALFISILGLLCFLRYHRSYRNKYRDHSNARYEKVPALSNPPSVPPKSSDNLYSLRNCEMSYSSDTLQSKRSCHGNSNNNVAIPFSGGGGYKVTECGSYCASIPETRADHFSPDLISTSFFTAQPHKGSKESLPPSSTSSLPLALPPLPPSSLHGTLPRRPKHEECKDSGSYRHTPLPNTPNFDVVLPGQTDSSCQDRCHSNESGVGSGHGSTPPTSETNFLRSESALRREAWLSSEDSLFKTKNNSNNALSSLHSLTGQKVAISDQKRQVRFQKPSDSIV